MFDLATAARRGEEDRGRLHGADPQEGPRGARPGAAAPVHGQARPPPAAAGGHGLLRRRPRRRPTLLDQLETEERRDRRRLLLDLLVVHGEPARAPRPRAAPGVARDAGPRLRPPQLDLPPAPRPPPGRRARRARDRRRSRASPLPAAPPSSSRRRSLYLGQTRHPRVGRGARRAARRPGRRSSSARTSTTTARGGGPRDPRPGRRRALARQGGSTGWRALVDHALSRRPELGATVARLSELGAQDLSPTPRRRRRRSSSEIRASLPRGVLGRLVGRKDQDLPASSAALAGTRTPEVRALLEEVRKRYAGQEPGQAAARALEAPPPAAGRRRSPATRASSTPTASPRCCTGSPRARPPAR